MSKKLAFIVLVAGAILMVPLGAMHFTDEVNWNLFDFSVAGTLLVGTGVMYVLLATKFNTARSRSVLVITLMVALILVWAELAVGIFGSAVAGS